MRIVSFSDVETSWFRTPQSIATLRGARHWLCAVLLAAVLPACNDSATEPDPPSEYISARRAWRPGEREAMIALVESTGALWGFSDLARYAFHPDSVTYFIRNPLYVAPRASARALLFHTMPGTLDTTWTMVGYDLRMIDNSQSPPDTTDWLQVFWYNNSEPTWKGYVVGASAGTTLGSTTVNTTAFDAAGGKSGAGAGEVRASITTYWQANGTATPNKYSISGSVFGATSTVTSGPWTGGTVASGTMYGRLNGIGFTRQTGTGLPATFTMDLDFRGTGVSASALTCIFPSPCTGQLVQAAPPSLRARLEQLRGRTRRPN